MSLKPEDVPAAHLRPETAPAPPPPGFVIGQAQATAPGGMLRAAGFFIELTPGDEGVQPYRIAVGGNMPAATFAVTQMLEALRVGNNAGILRLVADVPAGEDKLQVVLHEQPIARD